MTLVASRNHPFDCGTAAVSVSRNFQKRPLASSKFSIEALEVPRFSAPPSQTTVSRNKNGGTDGTALKVFLQSASANYVTDFLVSVQRLGVNYFQPITVTSGSPSVLSNPASDGLATHQSNGDCVFRAESVDGEVQLLKVTAKTLGGETVETFQSWASGSLARHCTDQIDGLIDGKTQLNVFNVSDWSVTPASFPRNPNCWANGIDLSCASPWNNDRGSLKAGTLVSPRHVVFCDHAGFYPANGKSITFVTAAGVAVTRTITNSVRAGDADIRIGLLDAAIEEADGIFFARVLPTAWADYLPGFAKDATVPVLCLNQTERASIAALRVLYSSFANIYPTAYPNYYGEIVVGDSGNPAFLIVNDVPVLLGVFTAGGAGLGSFITHYTSEVNAAMTALGGGYQLTPVDLSPFNIY